MLNKISDKLPIFLRLIKLRKFNVARIVPGVVVILAAAMVIGCAATPPPEPDESVAADDQAAELPDEYSDLDHADLDSDLLFHIMAAERLGAVGEYPEALEHYLEAAMMSDDANLARQVVSLAMRLEEWEAMRQGAMRWHELAPDEPSAVQFQILGLINLGQLDQAAAELHEIIRESDDDEAAWREAVVLMAAADDEDHALTTMQALIELDKERADRAEMLQHRSFLMWRLGHEDEAVELALKAAEIGEDAERKVWAAQLVAAREDMELALDLYRQASALKPEDLEIGLAEVEVLRELDRIDEAIERLAEIPAHGDVLYTLASLLLEQERMDEARDAWREMAAIEDPEDPERHVFLVAFMAELLELDDEALEWYKRVESGPHVERAKVRRAILKADHDRLDEARELLQEVRSGPDHTLHTQAWLVEAQILSEADRADEAVELLTGALRQSPNSVSLLYSRALSAVAMDDIELAEQDLRRILQIEDDNAMALNALGYTLTDRTDRHQEAYRLIRRALDLEPDDPAIQDSMGWVYFNLGHAERALPYLEKALEGEENPEIASHVGEVLLFLGREEEAMAVFDEYRERFPDDRYLRDTLKRLELYE
jgi:tetratricopeptide (TPR) repeat protein